MINTKTTGDLQARLEELQEKYPNQPPRDADQQEWEELEELLMAKHMLSYCWDEQATMIDTGSFTEYCREMAGDIGDINLCGAVEGYVNWEAYADAVRNDYKLVKVGDTDYLVRA